LRHGQLGQIRPVRDAVVEVHLGGRALCRALTPARQQRTQSERRRTGAAEAQHAEQEGPAIDEVAGRSSAFLGRERVRLAL